MRITVRILIMLCYLTSAHCQAQAGNIHEAVKTDNLAHIVELVRIDPNRINEKDNLGATPLHYAVVAYESRPRPHDIYKILVFLIQNGADLKVRLRENVEFTTTGSVFRMPKRVDFKTPLELADTYTKAEILSYAPEDALDEVDSISEISVVAWSSCLRGAVYKNDIPRIKRILRLCPNSLDERYLDKTALYLAVTQGSLEITELLLANDANPNISCGTTVNIRDTALHVAVSRCHADLVRLLLAHKADVNAINLKGETALHLAAFEGDEVITEILLAHGAEVTVEDKYSHTPLNNAIRFDHYGVAKILCKHGALKPLLKVLAIVLLTIITIVVVVRVILRRKRETR